MGQKVNPIGIRLCIVKKWNSNLYATNKNYSRLLNQDRNINDFYVIKDLIGIISIINKLFII